MAVFNFREVDEVTETAEDPRRPIPRIEVPKAEGPIFGSVTVHATVLALLFLIHPAEKKPPLVEKPAPHRVFFLPPELKPPTPPPAVARATPAPTPEPAAPAPTPPPPKSAAISIGEASDKRAEELRLERDRDIGRRASKTPQERAEPEQASPQSDQREGKGAGEDADRSGLMLPPHPDGRINRNDDPRAATPSGGLLSASTRSVERALRERRDLSQVEVPGYQMGPLFFDPEGADFTRWINHFKSEVYRNWIIPEPALLGLQGKVGIEFTVERGGRISRLTLVSSSGVPALDRAAMNALQASLLLPLPDDYPNQSVTMKAVFSYMRG